MPEAKPRDQDHITYEYKYTYKINNYSIFNLAGLHALRCILWPSDLYKKLLIYARKH